MRRSYLKPRRRLRSELLSLIPILAFPVVIALTFPYRVIGFADRRAATVSVPSCAFVSLADGVEARAMDVVRAAFSVKPNVFRDLRADLSLSTLPEEAAVPVLKMADRSAVASSTALSYEIQPLPPTLAASEPEEIPISDEPHQPAAPAFPRDELLQID